MSADGAFVLPIDKPAGPTSHDIVARARRALRNRRIGHTGTLDPFASGLLLLCVGNATRLAEYLTGMDKTYVAEMKLGSATDTGDYTGAEIAASDAWRSFSDDDIRAAFAARLGAQMQTPSRYSAKKVDGVRAYDAARRGVNVDIPAVEVDIREIHVLQIDLPLVRFEVTCSSGTYVRALARDIGDDMNTGAHLTALRRTRIGGHDVADAIALEQLDDADAVQRAALSPLDAVREMGCMEISDSGVREISHGRVVILDDTQRAAAEDGATIALSHEGDLVAIARIDGRVARPKKVLVHG